MMSDRVLRALLSQQRTSFVPIWSCRRNDSIVPMKLGPQSMSRQTLAPSKQPMTRSSFYRCLSSEVPPTVTTPAADSAPSSSADGDTVTVSIEHGLPQLKVPLPSRDEPCLFTLKPVTHTIGDLLDMLKTEASLRVVSTVQYMWVERQ